MKQKRFIYPVMLILLFVLVPVTTWLVIADGGKVEKKSCFYNSLHATGEGMRFWYEENGGFKTITGIPYEKLDCQTCHVKSCDKCHAVKNGQKCSYSLKEARSSKTCLACHSREKVTFNMGRKNKCLDVHVANGMGCVDCHKGDDVHGDGTPYRTMRDDGAVKAKCAECHDLEGSESRSHTVHKGKLDCAACHVANTTSCLNCHFDKFLEQGTRKGNFFPPIQDWTLLVNYRGKVTAGNVQTLVYKGKTFITYAPYFTHAVQDKARKCADCHANKAVKLISKGKSVQMAKFSKDQMVSWKGVVPLVTGQLKWDFADKKDDQWILLKTREKPMIQLSCYATPLDKEQIKRMAKPYKK